MLVFFSCYCIFFHFYHISSFSHIILNARILFGAVVPKCETSPKIQTLFADLSDYSSCMYKVNLHFKLH